VRRFSLGGLLMRQWMLVVAVVVILVRVISGRRPI